MKRRLLPILMTLVLVCALPIWAAFVTSGDVTNPLVCTAGATLPPEPEPVAVSNATDLQSRIADGKSVKLTDNIPITETLEIAKSLTLDLNGYVLKMTGTGSVIHITFAGPDVEVEITDGEPGREHTGEYAALPAGGVITGGKAESGGGILLDGGCTLKLTGGCITDCRATDTGGGGVDLRGSTAILYISGTARIENCTAGEVWGANAIFNSGTMYADGGTVDGTVNNQGTIRRSEGAAAETVFNGTVYNRSAGTIIAGIYNETVENNGTITNGTITGGTFWGTVTNKKSAWGNEAGTISGGTFYGPIVNEAGPERVTGVTFAVRFDTDGGSEIEPTMVEHSHTVRPPSDPEKSGHTFTGWYLDNAPYDFATPVTAPLTLKAKWEKVPSSGGYYYYPTTDTKADDAKGSPKTADPGVALYAALSLLSLTGLTCTAKKR